MDRSCRDSDEATFVIRAINHKHGNVVAEPVPEGARRGRRPLGVGRRTDCLEHHPGEPQHLRVVTGRRRTSMHSSIIAWHDSDDRTAVLRPCENGEVVTERARADPRSVNRRSRAAAFFVRWC